MSGQNIFHSALLGTEVVRFMPAYGPQSDREPRYVRYADAVRVMGEYGGSFISSIARAWNLADAVNHARLLDAFGHVLYDYADHVVASKWLKAEDVGELRSLAGEPRVPTQAGEFFPREAHVKSLQRKVEALEAFRDAAVREFRAIQADAVSMVDLITLMQAPGKNLLGGFEPIFVRIREAAERGMRGGFQ